MKVRCDLQINDRHRKLVIVPKESEPHDHVALRLCAYILLWDQEPSIELSAKHPSIADQEFAPDCIALDEGGRVSAWIECGKTTLNKLDKLTRRYPGAQIVALRESEEEAKKLRRDAENGGVDRHHLLKIWAWKAGEFRDWTDAVSADTYVVGEARGRSLNLVINDVPIAADLTAW